MIVQRKLSKELKKVLVIGDACTDIYLKCTSHRLNPESTAPLVKITGILTQDGMAGNVAQCLRNLNLTVDTILSKEKSIKRRYIDSRTQEHILRVDFDVEKPTPLNLANLYTGSYSAVVISDYNKGFISYDDINYISKFYDCPIFLDTKKKNLDKFDPRIFIKINELEANVANVVPRNTIVTVGGNGAYWNDRRYPAYNVPVVDVCGAGDAFLAGLVFGYLTDFDNMLEYAIVNGSICVTHLGVYAPTVNELLTGIFNYKNQQDKEKSEI